MKSYKTMSNHIKHIQSYENHIKSCGTSASGAHHNWVVVLVGATCPWHGGWRPQSLGTYQDTSGNNGMWWMSATAPHTGAGQIQRLTSLECNLSYFFIVFRLFDIENKTKNQNFWSNLPNLIYFTNCPNFFNFFCHFQSFLRCYFTIDPCIWKLLIKT